MGAGRPTPSKQSTLVAIGPRFRGDDEGELFVLHRLALDKSLAALHLVGQRRLVDLDHDGVGLDAEVFHQRLRDVAHHAGLLFIGAAGGHADGNFRHLLSLPFLLPSWPGLSRPSTIFPIKQDVDARHKAGHDARINGYPHFTSWRAKTSRTLATISSSRHENCAGR